jgi:hypothetical protein
MKNKFSLALTSIIVVSLVVFTAFIGFNQSKSIYKPSAKVEFKTFAGAGESEGFRGASEWLFNRLKNQVSGEIDATEAIRMQALAFQSIATSNTQRNGNPSSVAASQWTELGPDNVGGRTRAVLFDNLDPTHKHMWAGGVSGGLWESNDAAATWHRCAGYFALPEAVATVVTIAQAPNGDLYVGTGEGSFYFLSGFGAAGFTGNGIFKSTDDGVTWTSLTSTQPTNQNSAASAWIGVNKIQVDPSNSNHIYAGTNKGLKISNDAGNTWVSAVGPSVNGSSKDVQVSNNGRVIAIVSNKPWLSVDNGATFTNVSLSGSGWPSTASSRVTISIAPSDENFVYAFLAATTGALQGVYVSTNGGVNWTMVCGAGNAQFDPFGGNGQGDYDNIVSVDPSNKYRAIFGGVELHEWRMVTENPVAGQWTQIASEFPASPYNPFYVHSDKHSITWHPSQVGIFYIGCDGGIFRSNLHPTYGLTFIPMNSGYNITQCYSVAIENTVAAKNQAMAGTQDNGTHFIDGSGNTAMSSMATGGGDGGWCDFSFLNPLATFQTVYYGSLSRSNNRGSGASSFYDSRIDPATASPVGENPSFASFITPIRLWESTNDILTGDSISFTNSMAVQNKDVTNGTSATYSGTLTVPIPIASPAAVVVLNTLLFVAGADTITCNSGGVLGGDGTGNVNGTTGAYQLTFNTLPAANIVLKAFFYVQYGAGTIFTLNSNVAGKSINHTVSSIVNPDDVVKVQDVIQSHLAVGFTSNNGVYITRRPLDFSTTPLWIKVAGTNSAPDLFSGQTNCLAWSPNGDHLFVGTSSGLVFRISNLASVTDSANGDVDYGTAPNPTCQVVCTRIGNFSGRDVTSLDVNPNNLDQVIVCLGNYSNTKYVYLSTNATTATGITGTFADKTGNLDNIGGVPCFTVTFDKYVANRALVGTEHGIYETSNITAASVSWAPAMTGLDYCPVDMIRQQRWEPWQVPNAGCFYIGTHGRGMWRDDSSFQAPTSINNPSNPYFSNGNGSNSDLRVFPNPVVDNSNVTFNLDKKGTATVKIYDLTGKVVFENDYENLSLGTNTIEFETSEMLKGIYIITVLQANKRIGSGRFIKMN